MSNTASVFSVFPQLFCPLLPMLPSSKLIQVSNLPFSHPAFTSFMHLPHLPSNPLCPAQVSTEGSPPSPPCKSTHRKKRQVITQMCKYASLTSHISASICPGWTSPGKFEISPAKNKTEISFFLITFDFKGFKYFNNIQNFICGHKWQCRFIEIKEQMGRRCRLKD